MTSDLSNYHREYSPYGSYSVFQFEKSDVMSVLKNPIEYRFVFFKCLLDGCKFEKNLEFKMSDFYGLDHVFDNHDNKVHSKTCCIYQAAKG